MPSINLPTINIPEEGLQSKKTMENILDTLQKYRKELNFLLMNLDTDNMPTIGGLIGDLEGDYSLINQTVDGILLSVGNISGDVSALELRADSISATVANNIGDIASLVITAQGIQSQVSSINTTVGSHTSTITQLDNEISSIVSFTDVTGNQIASKINQTATTISLKASKIDLTGITTIYDYYDTDNYIEMNGTSFEMYINNSEEFSITYGLTSGIDFRSYEPISFNTDVNHMYPTSYYDAVYFDATSDVAFDGNVSFLGADVEGIVACYYPSNWFYMDYGGGSYITVRDQYGDSAGRLYFNEPI